MKTTADGVPIPPGPWHDEPDRKEWRDESTGLMCLAFRGPLGHWCGYVGVPPSHPAWGLSYDGTPKPEHDEYYAETKKLMRKAAGKRFSTAAMDEIFGKDRPLPEAHPGIGNMLLNVNVHGGLTYASGESAALGIEDTPDLWMFGFDCAHAWDLIPGILRHHKAGKDEIYRDLNYVMEECRKLASQLAAMDIGMPLLHEREDKP